MSGATNYLELKLLDHVWGNTPYVPPSVFYVALFNIAPDLETGLGGTEVNTGSYARLAVNNNTTNFPNAALVSGLGTKQNAGMFTFITPTSDWGVINAVGMYDIATIGSGNLLIANTITPQTINTGNSIIFNPGDMTITLD